MAFEDYIQVARHQRQFGSRIRSRDYAKSFEETLVVDPFQLRKDLGVISRAVQDGSQLSPAPNAQEFDAFHRDLLARIEQIQMQQTATRIYVLQRFVGDLSSIRIESPDETLRPVFNRAVKVDLRKIVDDFKPRLLALRTNVGLASRAYSAFRFFNNRTIEANIPSWAWIMVAIISIGTAALVEIYINNLALAPKLPKGNIDSFMVAAAICFANVAPPFLIGFTFGRGKNLVRYLSRRQRHTRSVAGYLSLLGLLAGVAGVLMMNAFFAYSRWKLEDFASLPADAGPTDVGKAIAQNASQFSPSHWEWLYDPSSALMFIFGLIMAGLAAYHGAHAFLDPYPGYQAITKRKAEAESLFNRERFTRPDHLELRQGSGHLLTVAPTRAGKGVGQIVPNLLSWAGSTVVVDVKGENYLLSAGYRSAELGQKVFRFAPFEQQTDVWNPILSISIRNRRDEEEDARYLVNLIVTPSGTSENLFFENSAKNFLEGLLLYVRTNPLVKGERPDEFRHGQADELGVSSSEERANDRRLRVASYDAQVRERSMREVRRLLTLDDLAFLRLLDAMMTLSDRSLVNQAGSNLRKLMKGEGRTGTSILAFALEQTAVWAYQRVHEATYKPSHGTGICEPGPNDYEFSMLRTAPKGATLYLVVPPDYLLEYRSVLRVLIGTAMRDLRRSYVGEAREKPPVLMLLDEFPQLGYMQPIEQSLLYIAGYGVRYWYFVQDLSQLQLHYPNSWRTFMANTGTQTFFGVSDIATANLVSEMAGTTTVINRSYGANAGWTYSEGEQESHSHGTMSNTNWGTDPNGGYSSGGGGGTQDQWQHGTNRNWGVNAGRSTQAGFVGRRLIMPDEVMRMHDEEQIVFMKGQQPLRSSKPPFYANPEFQRRSGLSTPQKIEFEGS